MYEQAPENQPEGRKIEIGEEASGPINLDHKGEGGSEPEETDQKEVKAFIYGLKCPKTLTVLYVGKSVNPKSRFSRHCCEKSPYPVTKWIASLKGMGLSQSLSSWMKFPSQGGKTRRDFGFSITET